MKTILLVLLLAGGALAAPPKHVRITGWDVNTGGGFIKGLPPEPRCNRLLTIERRHWPTDGWGASVCLVPVYDSDWLRLLPWAWWRR